MTLTNVSALTALISNVEFGGTFTLDSDGNFTESDVYAPDVFHSDDVTELEVDGVTPDYSDWLAMTDMSGQDRYHGPVMHASEYISDSVTRELMRLAADELTVFALVVVECYPEDGEDEYPEPAGWAILYRPAAS